MKNLIIIFFFTLLTVFASENLNIINGYVYDKLTKKPIKNVYVELLDENDKVLIKVKTNSKGFFQASIDKNLKIKYITFSKKGYQKQVLLYNNKKYNVYLNKEESLDEIFSALDKDITIRSFAVGSKGRDESSIDSKSYFMSSDYYSEREISTSSNSLYFSYQNIEGKLTAGEINDFSKWTLWNDLTKTEFEKYKSEWGLSAQNRITVIIKNKFQQPIYNLQVKIIKNNNILCQAMTDNTGTAELWIEDLNEISRNELKLEVSYKNLTKLYDKPKLFKEGINYLNLDIDCLETSSIDIAFVVDATGSMQDEIDYLKADLLSIINSVKDSLKNTELRLGSVFYRDKDDEYLTKISDMSNDIYQTINFIKEQNADGGGDYPEAVHSALLDAIFNLKWNENSISKLIFLILDAPPHKEKDVLLELKDLIKSASEKGIKIIPVACSGIDKETEFLLRSFALLTNGTYTFLTNHSGIGNKHIEPSTDKYEVEAFNDLLKRLIIQYSIIPDCNYSNENFKSEDIVFQAKDSKFDKKISIKIYPNPSTGILNVDLDENLNELYIADLTGKLVCKYDNLSNGLNSFDISFLPNGTYFLVVLNDNKIYREKFLLIR